MVIVGEAGIGEPGIGETRIGETVGNRVADPLGLIYCLAKVERTIEIKLECNWNETEMKLKENWNKNEKRKHKQSWKRAETLK